MTKIPSSRSPKFSPKKRSSGCSSALLHRATARVCFAAVANRAARTLSTPLRPRCDAPYIALVERAVLCTPNERCQGEGLFALGRRRARSDAPYPFANADVSDHNWPFLARGLVALEQNSCRGSPESFRGCERGNAGHPPSPGFGVAGTPATTVKTKSRHAVKRDGSLQDAAVWEQQQKAYLSWKTALPTTVPLILMSTRYVPTPSALALRL